MVERRMIKQADNVNSKKEHIVVLCIPLRSIFFLYFASY